MLGLLFVHHQRDARGGRGARAVTGTVGRRLVHDHPRRHGQRSARRLALFPSRHGRLRLPGTGPIELGRARHRPVVARRHQSRLVGNHHGGQPRPGRNLVAYLDQHLLDQAGMRRGHVHGSLVTLQDGDGIVALDGRSRGDQNLDHGNVVEIADVRDQHVNRFAHVASPCLITRGLDRLFRDQSPACAGPR